MNGLVAYLVGVTFAFGLGLGGMTQPAKVLAFLDVAGSWDPSLMLVMVGAIAVYALAYRVALRQRRPVFAAAFEIPTRREVDAPLLAGSVLFGIGWGLAGLCPGPAIAALASGQPAALVFVATMLAGTVAARAVRGRDATRAATEECPTVVRNCTSTSSTAAASLRRGSPLL